MHCVDAIIIGNGVSSKVLVNYLNKIGLKDIVVIASDRFAPQCSLRSTSVNCLRGTTKGISQLGDLIVDSFKEFESFYNENKPYGVEKGYEYRCWFEKTPEHDKWLKRFKKYSLKSSLNPFYKSFPQDMSVNQEDAYMITPELFFNYFDNKNICKYENDIVTEVQNSSNKIIIKTQKQKQYECQKLFICTGYMSKVFMDLLVDETIKNKLNSSKPVTGTYLKFNQGDFDEDEVNFNESFSIAYQKSNFIYRKLSKDILIGSTSTNNELNFFNNNEQIKLQFDEMSAFFKDVITFPSINKAQFLTGIRHKGKKRLPFWGKINQNIYATWGLYKNGYTFSFLAAKELANLIQK